MPEATVVAYGNDKLQYSYCMLILNLTFNTISIFMLKGFLFILLLFTFLYCYAQPSILLSKTYGSSQGAEGYDMQPTPDGNFIVLAATYASDSDVVCNHHFYRSRVSLRQASEQRVDTA
jgi:hypothetical protein